MSQENVARRVPGVTCGVTLPPVPGYRGRPASSVRQPTKEGRMMRRTRMAAATLMVAAGLIGAVAAPASAAQPTTPRQDDYTQSVCTIEGVGTFPAERYDRHAIGGHETAVSHFNLHHPGIVCQAGS